MKPEDQIKALAELDGWVFNPGHFLSPKGRKYLASSWESEMPTKYLISYDAIIPLIQKQIDNDNAVGFWDALDKITDFFEDYGHVGTLKATPPQLCEALLRAAGRWGE